MGLFENYMRAMFIHKWPKSGLKLENKCYFITDAMCMIKVLQVWIEEAILIPAAAIVSIHFSTMYYLVGLVDDGPFPYHFSWHLRGCTTTIKEK